MPTKLSIGGNIGVAVGPGTTVGVGVSVGVTVGGIGVFVDVAAGLALCVSAKTVLTVDMAVSMISASLIVGVDWLLPQDASITAARNKGINNVLPKMFILPFPLMFCKETPNASRLFQGCAIRVGSGWWVPTRLRQSTHQAGRDNATLSGFIASQHIFHSPGRQGGT